MWPMLLNLTHDECRRTLRRLELEAYSNMISVFRAQGALEDNRKKLLEDLRAVLHISNDRHSAEARRVSNDELLATIAEQLAGPNTGLAWISEGRRLVPLLPRGVPQTMYTEIADKAAEIAAAENKELQKKLEADKLVAPKSNEEEMADAEGETAEDGAPSSETMDELLYPPIAMEDQSAKLWETELITPRKRKVTEGALPDAAPTPMKNKRNIPANTNQKHLNLSQIYSKFSQPATSKPSGQSKHSYNQVSKVSTSKSSHATQSAAPKQRGQKRNKNPAPIVVSKSQSKRTIDKSTTAEVLSPSKYTPSMVHDYSGPPNTFQASYAQAVLGGKSKQEYIEEMKPKVSGMSSSSGAMQLATAAHELEVSEAAHADPASLQAQATPPPKHTVAGKPCHLVLKNKGEITDSTKKVHMSDLKILHKSPSEGVKLISNKQVVVASSAAQKSLNANTKLVTTKVIGSVPKPRGSSTPMSEKLIVVSKPSSEKGLTNSKILITSSSLSTPGKVATSATQNISPPTTQTLTPKGIPATDLKVSAKAVVLNPKSGQKMVVLPAKARTKSGAEGQMPVVPMHFKGLHTSMKLVQVSSQGAPAAKPQTVTMVSKPPMVNTLTPKKIIGVEPIKTANLADIIPVKGMTPVSAPKITNPIMRPVNKGNVIVVQKGSTIGKTLTFTKNGNDMSKIIMGKNVNQLLQATKPDQAEAAKCAGNVIVLELNNEQSGRTTTMSEILDSRTSTARVSDGDKKVATEITPDTPVLFDNRITEETCNANSLDSTSGSIGDIVPMVESGLPIMKEEGQSNLSKDSGNVKDSSSVTDWEMELDTVTGKEKDEDNKLNALHLDLGMSSDDDNDYMSGHKAKSKHSSQESAQQTPSGESSVYSSASGMSLATRTLLSQLQDDGSSSNDSSFALKSKSEKVKESDSKIDKSESDALTKAKEKLTEKVAKSQQKRIDIYSTAISTSEINLDAFSYLDETIMAGDDEFADSANSTDSQTVSESLPLNK